MTNKTFLRYFLIFQELYIRSINNGYRPHHAGDISCISFFLSPTEFTRFDFIFNRFSQTNRVDEALTGLPFDLFVPDPEWDDEVAYYLMAQDYLPGSAVKVFNYWIDQPFVSPPQAYHMAQLAYSDNKAYEQQKSVYFQTCEINIYSIH